MPLGALELICWVLAGIIIVGAAWRFMVWRIERSDDKARRRRLHDNAERWKNLR